jgi:hypothetical protein
VNEKVGVDVCGTHDGEVCIRNVLLSISPACRFPDRWLFIGYLSLFVETQARTMPGLA